MSKDVEFDKNEVCDICGKEGAYDFIGDLICPECLKLCTEGDKSVKVVEPKRFKGRI